MDKKNVLKPMFWGISAAAILLGFYFSVLTFVSGWQFAKEQFLSFWYFIVALAIGFGIQIGLYIYARNLVRQNGGKKILAVSGATSTIAMISCCAHYLANFLPILAISGIAAIIAQYQIQLFWFGLLANFSGIVYMANKVAKLSKRGLPGAQRMDFWRLLL